MNREVELCEQVELYCTVLYPIAPASRLARDFSDPSSSQRMTSLNVC